MALGNSFWRTMKVALLHGASNIFILKLKSKFFLNNLKLETKFCQLAYFLEHIHIRHLHFVAFILLILCFKNTLYEPTYSMQNVS